MLLLLLLGACAPSGRAWFGAGSSALAVDTDQLDLGVVQLGSAAYADLVITNSGEASAEVTLAAAAPFGVLAESAQVGAGASVVTTVFFQPEGYAPSTGTLTVSWPGGALEVALSGSTNPDSDQDGQAAVEVGGTDCDDQDARTYVGAPDACYDGVDSDCQQDDDDDCDGDGYPIGVDCDDDDPARSPDATDGANGVDDDCDGLVDEALLVPGDIVITEVFVSDDAAWFELCNVAGRTVDLSAFSLDAGGGGGIFEQAVRVDDGDCTVVCPTLGTPCAIATAVPLAVSAAAPLDDTVTLAAGDLVLDVLAVDPTWGWTADSIRALDGRYTSAAENDDPDRWCPTGDPTKGTPNPHC